MAAMDGEEMDQDEEVCEQLVLARGQDPDVEEDQAFYGSSGSQEEDPEPEQDAMDEEDVLPPEPDVEWYLSLYDITDAARVSICRTYASYLVARGKTGIHKPGPPSDLKKKAMDQGRWSN
jgi:hypothetical protein